MNKYEIITYQKSETYDGQVDEISVILAAQGFHADEHGTLILVGPHGQNIAAWADGEWKSIRLADIR